MDALYSMNAIFRGYGPRVPLRGFGLRVRAKRSVDGFQCRRSAKLPASASRA